MAGHVKRYFPFVQLEFTHSLGLAAGRYLMQPDLVLEPVPGTTTAPEAARTTTGLAPQATFAEDPEAAEDPVERGAGDHRLLASADVLVVRVRGAKASSGLFMRRGQRDAVVDEDKEVPLTVATIVRGREMLETKMAGDELLRTIEGPTAERWAAEGIADLNRAVGVYRVCAADPYVFDVSRADARAVRVGYGMAEDVYQGRWARAVVVPQPRAPRMPRQLQLAPSEGTAAVLAGQAGVMECEELLLRVLIDLDQDRVRAAAVGLSAAFSLLRGELAGQVLSGAVRLKMDEIAELGEEIGELAKQALRRRLSAEEARAVVGLAEQVGAAIDRWRYEPRGY